eukprot:SAG31_NODE_3340_length_4380_cov_23.463119_2_plen_59_part_00
MAGASDQGAATRPYLARKARYSRTEYYQRSTAVPVREFSIRADKSRAAARMPSTYKNA